MIKNSRLESDMFLVLFLFVAQLLFLLCFAFASSSLVPSLFQQPCDTQPDLAAACGIEALFMEVHDNPSKAKSDPNTVLDIKDLKKILIMTNEIHKKRIEIEKKYGFQKIK